ncbi:Fibronectin type III domain protein [Metarhizium album ARSEF 1941]|uniref:Fibronectin type III domain protein n=1 Tax=Metarhizium album (strain ARSEF 1941) TaxID=1081103 RepID=A0A0B2WTH8_METAS|nr:Fibronectin type III domain protein [Metarhizium album ARSEF 1941]KHN96757.1 Fibronectin type III domain protein [Metarhizium album ARSEF 1941]
MTWEPLSLITLLVTFLALGLCRRYLSGSRTLLYAIVTALLLRLDGRAAMYRIYFFAHDAVINASPVARFKMGLTLGAVIWLVHRAIQTIWKPIPELVNILGLDIPPPPDVCLAGIRSDSAYLTWDARTASQRPVQKLLIQVNGVDVDEVAGNEKAITITGLRPNHFYNIRVIAVSPNNFRSNSTVIRLRTFGKDGRPRLGNSRLPTSFVDPGLSRATANDDADDSDGPGFPYPTVEATPVNDGVTGSSRDLATGVPGQRRNTLHRRHSPSVASTDQGQVKSAVLNEPEMSLADLNERFEAIRREIDDVVQLAAKEQAEALQQEDELKRERDRKRQALKEKEECTTQLKAMMRTTMEQMRAAEKERAKKEQQLREKETKKSKIKDSISKFEKEVERMRKEREDFQTQRREMEEKRDHAVKGLNAQVACLQEKCAGLEAELAQKGKQLQDLKATREQLPDANDEQWKEEDQRLRREWEVKRRDLHNRLVTETKFGHNLDQQIRALADQLAFQQQQAGLNFFPPLSSTAVDFDPAMLSQAAKRLSFPGPGLGGTPVSSPPLAHAEPQLQGNVSFGAPTFGPGLFMDMSENNHVEAQSEAELKAATGPLSPSAQTLLPSNIFDDTEEHVDVKQSQNPILPQSIVAEENGPQSPVSPAPSFHVLPSPHGSANHLPFHQYADSGDQISLNMPQSPPARSPASVHRFSTIFSPFSRSTKAPKTSDEDGPPIGSLKVGQSQSFPRGTEEGENMEFRRRLWPWGINSGRNSTGQESPSASLNYFSARRVNSLKGSRISAISDREQDPSRPSSIISIDHPRPSTDSASIWGAPGDAATNLKNTSADDEILEESDLRDPHTSPSQIGVIGSRPPAASSKSLMSQRLNPTAPTFMGNIFRKDKDKDGGKDKPKEDKGKGKEVGTPASDFPEIHDDSLSDSRISRDTCSLHTGTSVSESRESLQLDLTQSNTPSDMNSVSTSNAKDSDNVVRKLFRKGSSSKFSLSSRLGKDSGLFKKGPGSTSNSDRNASAEQRTSIGNADDLGEDGAAFGRSYDSMTSSPSLGPSKSKDSREGRMSSWRFSMRKKTKDAPARDKESLEIERAPDDFGVGGSHRGTSGT